MKRRRLLLLAVALIGLFVGIPGWLVYRELQQEKLDRALIEAIQQENIKATLSALEQGANANALYVPPDERSPWERLLDRFRSGFRPSSQQDAEATPALFLACAGSTYDNDIYRLEKIEVIKSLIKHGADVNIQAREGTSPLMRIVSASYSDLVPLLLEHGADVNARNLTGATALILAGWGEDNVKTVRLLLDHDADIHARDDEGDTALLTAVKSSNSDVAQLLLERGANVNVCNQAGENALFCALYSEEITPKEKVKIVKILLAHHVNINSKLKSGETPLAAVQRDGNATLVKLFRQAGANE